MLGDKTSQWYREIKPHRDIVFAVIEAEHLSIGFFATFAAQDFGQLKGRGVDRHKTVRSINGSSCFHQLLARDHHFGQKIPEASESAG